MRFDITSSSNERIKWLARMRNRKHRDAERLFVVEGERLYRRALAAGIEPHVTFTSDAIETVGETLRVAPDVLDKASYRRRSQKIIGVFPQFDTSLTQLDPPSGSVVLIAEDIEKPGNLGAMTRTAVLAGAEAVVAVGSDVDPFNANAVHASTGAIWELPLAVSSWDELEPWLAHRNVRVLAASPTEGASLWETDLTGSLAVVIGAEDRGLSERAASVAHQLVAIPQATSMVDSLNTSVAAAVVLFEAARQRAATGDRRESGDTTTGFG